MPVYKGWHEWFCGKTSWNIQPCLSDKWNGSNYNCPLDVRAQWHDIHDVDKANIIDWTQIPKETPSLSVCVDLLIKRVFENLEKYFESFIGFILKKHPDISIEQIRTCWKAHLIADYGCRYWYESKGKIENKYTEMNQDYQRALKDFVKDVGNHILRESSISNP